MNYEIQNKLRRTYRAVENGIKPAVGYIADNDIPIVETVLRGKILESGAEVQSEIEALVDAIIEDIANPNRSESFSEFEEETLETAKKIVADEPALFYRSDWEKEVARRVAESNDFFDLTVDVANKKALGVMYSKEAFEAIRGMLSDMADLEEMRKDPDKYFAAPQ